MTRTSALGIAAVAAAVTGGCSPAVDGPERTCSAGDSRCNGTVVETCVDGELTADTDCSALGFECVETAAGAGCHDTGRECEDGYSACNGSVVESCVEGHVVTLSDCADDGLLCEEAPGSGQATCVEGGSGDCADGEERCDGTALSRCTGGAWVEQRDCADAGQDCAAEGTSAACTGLAWTHLVVEIQDHIMVGSSLVVPIDGISYGYDPGRDLFFTAFSRDIDDPSISYMWEVDGSTGIHRRNVLSGDPFSPSEAFCVGEEPWCQAIGFDPSSSEVVVVGPSTSAMMRVDTDFRASLHAVRGAHPPDSWIDHTQRFDWTARSLFLYGAVGPSGFSDSVYALDLDSGDWTRAASDLPQVTDNCIAYVPDTETLYSFAGRVTEDGGESSQRVATYRAIDLSDGTSSSGDLPTEIGARQSMACAYDSTRDVVYVFGGCEAEDRFNDASNTFYNDLWAFDVHTGEWTRLMESTEGGTLGDPDDYGDRAFTGDPSGPNFGKNRGRMSYDASRDRLVVVGAVPISTHEQMYFLDLGAVDDLLP